MKAPVGLLSDRTVLRSKMEGPRPDKFVYVFPCQEGWHHPALSLFAKVFCVFSCILPKVACFQKFAFAKRSAAMKAPVRLLSDRMVLRTNMEGPRPDKFTLTRLDF